MQRLIKLTLNAFKYKLLAIINLGVSAVIIGKKTSIKTLFCFIGKSI